MTTSIQEWKARKNRKDWKVPVVIFALNTMHSKESEKELVETMLGRSVKQVEGSYKGEREVSYVVSVENDREYQKILKVAKLYKQESILYVNSDRYCTLVFLNISSTQDIGKMRAVSPAYAMEQEAWTRDGSQFYVVEW